MAPPFAHALANARAARSARSDPGRLRVRVDPLELTGTDLRYPAVAPPFAHALANARAARSARKDPGRLRVQVDPLELI